MMRFLLIRHLRRDHDTESDASLADLRDMHREYHENRKRDKGYVR